MTGYRQKRDALLKKLAGAEAEVYDKRTKVAESAYAKLQQKLAKLDDTAPDPRPKE